MKKAIFGIMVISLLGVGAGTCYADDNTKKIEEKIVFDLKLDYAYSSLLNNNFELKTMERRYAVLKSKYEDAKYQANNLKFSIDGDFTYTKENAEIAVNQALIEMNNYNDTLQAEKTLLKNKVQKVFLDLTLMKERIKMEKENLTSMDSEIENVKTKINFGLLKQSDLIDVENSKKQQEVKVDELEEQHDTSIINLKKDLGLDTDLKVNLENISREYKLSSTIDNLKAKIDNYISNSKEIKNFDSDVEQINRSIKALRTDTVRYKKDKKDYEFQILEKQMGKDDEKITLILLDIRKIRRTMNFKF